MSKSADSLPGSILLLEDLAGVASKIKRAVTDTDNEVRYDPATKPGVSNLLSILAASTGRTPEECAEQYTQYGPLKADTADAVVALLEPIQARYRELEADPAATTRHPGRRGRPRPIDRRAHPGAGPARPRPALSRLDPCRSLTACLGWCTMHLRCTRCRDERTGYVGHEPHQHRHPGRSGRAGHADVRAGDQARRRDPGPQAAGRRRAHDQGGDAGHGGNGLRHRPRGAAPAAGNRPSCDPGRHLGLDRLPATRRKSRATWPFDVRWLGGPEVATTDIVQLEILAGARESTPPAPSSASCWPGSIHLADAPRASTPSRRPRSTGRAGARARRPASSTTA